MSGKKSGAHLALSDLLDGSQNTDKRTRERDDLLRNLFEGSHDAIFLFSTSDLAIHDCNRRAAELLGRRRQEIIGMAVGDVCPIDHSALNGFVQHVVSRGHGFSDQLSCIDSQGVVIPVEVSATSVSVDGSAHLLASVRDVREQMQAKLHIDTLSYHDMVTGLPNRALFVERLERAVFHAGRTGARIALLLVDLDQFKNINDSLGHSVGDALLNGAAARLVHHSRGEDTVARLGGDEFVILLNGLHTDGEIAEQETLAAANKIRTAFEQPVLAAGNALHITASVGAAVYPHHGDDSEALLRHAESAMYRAKSSGPGNVRLFTLDMATAANHRLTLFNALRRAVHGHEFTLAYQPQIALNSGRVVSCEALLRWPSAEEFSPSQFIPVLEETGLIVPVGDWVLREATRTLKQALTEKRCHGDARVAVNISPRQFAGSNFVHRVAQILAANDLAARNLELEITEGVLIRDKEAAISRIRLLREMGVRIAIDDFGTGYSSLAYLKQLPIHVLKIDQSFVRDISDTPADVAIIETVLTMARVLNLEVVAEGVETAHQMHALRIMGCKVGQGYFLGRPNSDGDQAFIAVTA